MRGRPNRKRGVTWLEVVLGTGSLAVLVLGAGMIFSPKSEALESETALRDAERIHEAVEKWRADNPSGFQTLSQLKQEKRLASQAATDDPWGQRFRVDCSGERVMVV